MKPTFQFAEKSRRGLEDRKSIRGSNLPQTDYGYQPAPIVKGGGRCFGTSRRSFHTISDEYFQNEARRDFATEAALFIVIVMTAALPILSSLSALTNLVRSYAAL